MYVNGSKYGAWLTGLSTHICLNPVGPCIRSHQSSWVELRAILCAPTRSSFVECGQPDRMFVVNTNSESHWTPLGNDFSPSTWSTMDSQIMWVGAKVTISIRDAHQSIKLPFFGCPVMSGQWALSRQCLGRPLWTPLLPCLSPLCGWALICCKNCLEKKMKEGATNVTAIPSHGRALTVTLS